MSVLKELMEKRQNWAVGRAAVQSRQLVRKTVVYAILLMMGALVLFNHQWIINDLSWIISWHP